MIIITLTACSILHGSMCREITLPLEMAMTTPYACMIGGQQSLTKWAEQNPNWRIHGWSCVAKA